MQKLFFFRSMPMTKCQMLLCTETAYECMLELGRLEKVQLIEPEDDSNGELIYQNTIKRCSELLRVIDFIEAQINELNLNIVYYPNVMEDYPPAVGDLGKYENELYDADMELRQYLFNLTELYREREENDELGKAMRVAEEILRDENVMEPSFAWSDSVIMKILQTDVDDNREQQLTFLLGSLGTERFFVFERVLFRTVRTNYYIRGIQIKLAHHEPLKADTIERKTVFVLCYTGKILGERILKICNAFGVKKFHCPLSGTERRERRLMANKEVVAIDEVIRRTEAHRSMVLNVLAADLYIWKFNTMQIMACYVELNKMTIVQPAKQVKYLTCLCWMPFDCVSQVREVLMRAAIKGSKENPLLQIFPPMLTKVELERKEMPPTYFQVNKFTSGFQTLIDAYGLANYRELNPAPYTIVTFPFLFAVMFGDVGHGILMALFALALIWKNNAFQKAETLHRKPNEIGKILFGGRYIIFLMGIFSIYTGLIYNDFFSKSLNIFGSHWYVDKEAWGKKSYDLNPESAANYQGEPYVFGMDPVWKISGDSAIITYNSVKMKLAIILGVFHMIFGLVLNAINQLYFKSYVDLLLISIPQLIIFSSLFFYLVILIFYKWSHFGGHLGVPYNTACAPSILITFIDMILMKQSVIPQGDCEATMFEGQLELQKFLVFFALLCIPILLAGKPIYFHVQQRRIRKQKDNARKKRLSETTSISMRKALIYQIDWSETLSGQEGRKSSIKSIQIEEAEEYDMMEVWIHSGIHAIDSVLGAVSHTASYLRLWALSLAHEQLSDVLWVMVLTLGFDKNYYYSIALFFSFAIWALLTFAVLVTMEALSAFLHTLRLHWVEFQSKFYIGAGEAFTPFVLPKPNKYI